MATNTTYIDAPPEAVWEVLADARSYAHWVVGSSRTPHVEGGWPAEGAVFHHVQGIGPIGLRDTTEVIESDPAHRLVLEVRVRPFLVARVELTLNRHGGGTWISMTERAFGGMVGPAGLLLEPATFVRNIESLRRLRRLAEKGGAR